MSENEMGNRGSKSVSLSETVKEQRVDGSWFLANRSKARSLRCTLMGGETSYQVNIPYKQLNSYFSTLTKNNGNNIINHGFYRVHRR